MFAASRYNNAISKGKWRHTVSLAAVLFRTLLQMNSERVRKDYSHKLFFSQLARKDLRHRLLSPRSLQ